MDDPDAPGPLPSASLYDEARNILGRSQSSEAYPKPVVIQPDAENDNEWNNLAKTLAGKVPEQSSDNDIEDPSVSESNDSLPVEPRRSVKTTCILGALFFQDELRKPGIGKHVYKDSRITVRFGKFHPSNSAHYFGIQFMFPRSEDTSLGKWYEGIHGDDLKLSSRLIVVAKFPQGCDIQYRCLSDEEYNAIKPLVLQHPNDKDDKDDKDNDFGIISITLPDSQYPTVMSMGLPFVGKTSEITRYITHDDPVEGKTRLSRLLSQRKWMFIARLQSFGDRETLLKLDDVNWSPFSYGYPEREHKWDSKAYEPMISENRGKQFSAMTRYDTPELRDTALEHLHVQDKIGGKSVDDSTKFVALVMVGEEWMVQHQAVLRRSIEKMGCRLRLTIYRPGPIDCDDDPADGEQLDPDEQLDEDCDADNHDPIEAEATGPPDKSTWDATTLPATHPVLQNVPIKGCIAVSVTRPRKRAGGSDEEQFKPLIGDSYADALAKCPTVESRNTVSFIGNPGFKNEARRVEAVHRLRRDAGVWPHVAQKQEHLRQPLDDLLTGNGLTFIPRTDSEDTPRPSFQLPKMSIFDFGATQDVIDMCRKKLAEDDRKRFDTYFGNLYLGVGIVSAPGGFGKSRLLAIIVNLLCQSSEIGQVIVSAPSNGASDNIEERISRMSDELMVEYASSGLPVRTPMSVRGYAIDREVSNCLAVISGHKFKEGDELDPSPWQFRHSLCWWTLRALGCKIENVDCLQESTDNEELWSLHCRLQSLLTDEPEPEEEHDEDDETDMPATPKQHPFSAFGDLVKIANGKLTVEAYREKVEKNTLRRDIDRLMLQVVRCANVVVVTPIMSSSKPYRSFNCHCARAVVLDEAAAMHRTDGLLVYGNTPRVLIAVGDEKQLPPTLMSSGERDQFDQPVNRFADDAKLSFLSWWLHLGFPAFHLFSQHRMAPGMFDLSLELVYSNLKAEFKYSASSDFPYAANIRGYLTKTHNFDIPEGRMSPIFIDCKDCPSRVDEISKSRHNPRAIDCMIRWLKAFLGDVKIPTEHFAILTPYRANRQRINIQMAEHEELKGIPCSTVDSFQGKEADIILLCLANDQQSGPGFAAHPRRLNVATTRQRTALFIFGDINTVPEIENTWQSQGKAKKTIEAFSEDGAKLRFQVEVTTDVWGDASGAPDGNGMGDDAKEASGDAWGTTAETTAETSGWNDEAADAVDW
ncbi:hypothetical protein ACJZ2D_006612 [Fusarium nematophilum]